MFEPPSFDADQLCSALRSLGLLYGAAARPSAAGGLDEDAAIRAYLLAERPHLLASYDLDSLVALVKAARASADAGHSLEQFAPA